MARASGANVSASRAREIPPAIAAASTRAALSTSIMRCSSPTLIQVTWSTIAASAGSVSLRWASAITRIPRARAARATARGKTPLPAIRPRLFTIAADHTALRVRDEIDQAAHFGNFAALGQDLFDRVVTQQLAVKERAKRTLERGHRLRREAAPLESGRVDSNQPRPIARHHRERRHVLRHLGAGRDQ